MTNKVAETVVSTGLSVSPFPASFGGSPWLYGGALASLMAIGSLALIVACWMIRDIWRDRINDHPTTLTFLFRLMVGIVCLAAFMRCLPEVAWLTLYGEPTVQAGTLANVLAVKRAADMIALPIVLSWMAILVTIYPFVIMALKTQDMRRVAVVDYLSVWYRLARPFFMVLAVVLLSALIAASKGHVWG